jgi:hypothetical protein
VVSTTESSIRVDLARANAHARRALAAADPPVRVSRASGDDLLTVMLTSTARMMRNGATGAPLSGDHVVVKYRAPRTVRARCAGTASVKVTVSGTPPSAQFGGANVTLVRITASPA